ncbi:uncharacterized protein ARMOST_02298 [Armillaria ostoyae]|uniref:Uncharacterized protein n=1 Tax=Armillaria ostoyae TaxID=47428 RepID=A0A284QRE2_ARMOS|nr:uncharacterized protein ARMOST_02298 [Armillaria ostoyae]
MNKWFGGSDNDFVVERKPHLSDTATCQFTQRIVVECVDRNHADQDPARDVLNCQSSPLGSLFLTYGRHLWTARGAIGLEGNTDATLAQLGQANHPNTEI